MRKGRSVGDVKAGCEYETEVVHGVVQLLAWCQVLLVCEAGVLVRSALL